MQVFKAHNAALGVRTFFLTAQPSSKKDYVNFLGRYRLRAV